MTRVWNLYPWIAAGLVFAALSLSNADGPRSPLWFSEFGLYALMIFGLRVRTFLPLSRRAAPIAYVGLVLVFGAIYESSLTVDGTGFGGMHPDTTASYLLAAGDYLMLAIAALVLIRRYHLTFRQTYFLAAGISLSEGLIFTGVLTAILTSAQAYLVPLFVAYYALAYAGFIALPLVLINPDLLWRGGATDQPGASARHLSIPLIWVIGFGLAFVVRVIWGLLYGPAITALFNLPPGVPGL